MQIGTTCTNAYREWAWDGGKNQFPKELFNSASSGDGFFKYAACKKVSNITPFDLGSLPEELKSELNALRAIQPHAVITTNYDQFLELVFPDHKPIIGQSAYLGSAFTLGEIFKIHGCVSEPENIVINEADYAEFMKKKKYISAKLLTLFSEHPLVIIGYGASDPNIQAILSDIDEALALPGELIENIYFVEYMPNLSEEDTFPTEKLIQIAENRSVRVKLIVADEFGWVFNAFKSPQTLNSIPPSMLRALLNRSYELTRTNLPQKKLNVDFQFLEQAVQNNQNFAKLFGISTVSSPSALTAHYPYTITDLGKALGGSSWHPADKYMKIVERDTGYAMRQDDSVYHVCTKSNTTEFRKYSDKALDLLTKVKMAGKAEKSWLLI